MKKILKKTDIEQDVVPVVRAEIPNPLSPGSFYDSILNSLGAYLVKKQTVDEKKQRIVHHLKGLKTEMLILDEFQHIYSGKKNNVTMEVVKHLANISNVVLVCVGLEEINELRKGEQYNRRFKKLGYPRFPSGDMFIKLLYSIEKDLELEKESRIWDKETGLPQWLHSTTGGVMGFLMPLIQEAYQYAITPNEKGVSKQRIDKEILAEIIDCTPEGLEA